MSSKSFPTLNEYIQSKATFLTNNDSHIYIKYNKLKQINMFQLEEIYYSDKNHDLKLFKTLRLVVNIYVDSKQYVNIKDMKTCEWIIYDYETQKYKFIPKEKVPLDGIKTELIDNALD